MKRRAFVILAEGLHLERRALVPLPRQTVELLGKKCSFCDKPMSKSKSMSGFVGCPLRVCDECVLRCVEVVGSKDDLALPSDAASLLAVLDGPPREKSPPLRSADLMCSFCEEKQPDMKQLVAAPVDYICRSCIATSSLLARTASPV
jgi:hypothetical protein